MTNGNIIPFPGKVWLKLETMKLGGIELKGDNMVSEVGVVVALPPTDHPFLKGHFPLKLGDRVYFKAWGLDHIQIDGEDYYVADLDSKAILGKEK